MFTCSVRVLLGATTLCVMHPGDGNAQMFQASRTTQVQIEYREPMPADGDMSAVRAKIYAQVQKDCDAAAKAFSESCAVGSINFGYVGGFNGQPPQGMSAHAQLMLSSQAKPPSDPAK